MLAADRERVVVDAFRSAGAVSPAAARPLAALPPLPTDALDRCLESGRVREGTPGTFCLYERQRGTARKRLLALLGFWLIVILVPILVIQLTH